MDAEHVPVALTPIYVCDVDERSFGNTTVGLAGNPLGIIALFLVLVYGLASMVITKASFLTTPERTPLIYFLVTFPVLVLGVFAWLVSHYPGNLFSPSDFRNEENYLTVLAPLTTAAVVKRQIDEQQPPKVDFQVLVDSVRHGVKPRRSNWERPRILWVGDHPEDNLYERQAFENSGVAVTRRLQQTKL